MEGRVYYGAVLCPWRCAVLRCLMQGASVGLDGQKVTAYTKAAFRHKGKGRGAAGTAAAGAGAAARAPARGGRGEEEEDDEDDDEGSAFAEEEGEGGWLRGWVGLMGALNNARGVVPCHHQRQLSRQCTSACCRTGSAHYSTCFEVYRCSGCRPRSLHLASAACPGSPPAENRFNTFRFFFVGDQALKPLVCVLGPMVLRAVLTCCSRTCAGGEPQQKQPDSKRKKRREQRRQRISELSSAGTNRAPRRTFAELQQQRAGGGGGGGGGAGRGAAQVS